MSALDRMVRDIEALKTQYRALATGPQLALSSIENGSIDSKDADGNLKMTIGMQDDGSNTINVVSGPTPSTPTPPQVSTDYGALIVRWDGGFLESLIANLDWSRTEIHAHEGAGDFTASRATARGSIVAASGGEVTIGVLKGTWTIKLIAWSQAGIMSAPSEPITVEVAGYGDLVQEAIDEAQTLIDQAKEALEQGQADLAEKITEAETALATLQDTLDNLDDTTLPALRQDLDDAKGRLSEAESDLTNAFGRLDEVPGQIGAAKQAAIDAAQADAQAKANAARSAAEAAAAQDALSKANAARDAAIASASSDAQVKADAARQAAETAAKADAKAKADAAQAAAIAAAALDATQKANAAQSAAEARAQAAQVAADAAMSEAESKASIDYILSRGTDLVTNGTGYLNDNTNFSGFVFDPADAPTGARGSFDKDGTATIETDELMPVDSSRRYLMRLQARQTNPNAAGATFLAGVRPYDGDGLPISPPQYRYDPASMVKLAQDLKKGDTVAVVEPGSNWSNTTYTGFSAWNYVDRAGKKWKAGTYTRNIISGANPTLSGNQVTLSRAWTYDTVPAGTYVSSNAGGSSYMYVAAGTTVVPQDWTTFSGSTLKGSHDGATGPATRQLPPGTAGIRLIFLMSYNGIPAGQVSKQSIAAVSFSDATLALEEAEVAQAASAAAQATANAAQTAAGSAQSAADAAMTTANGLAKVLHGTTVATGTAPNGSIWWQHQGTLSGPVIGQWNRVSGSWVSTPIRSEAIANLDLGKLTAGAGAIAELVSKKIAAAVGQFLELDVGQLTVTGTSQMADVVAEKIAAEVGEFIRLEVGQLVAGEGVMDEATIQKLFTDVVVAGIAQAQEFIGENAILTGAITAPKITASEELTAKVAEFLRVRAEMIEADAIDGMVITAPTIQSARNGRRWVAGTDGIRIIDENDEVRTDLNPEGSTFKGEVEADSLVVNNGAEFKSEENILAQGAKLTLAAGVTNPTAPPTVQPYWNSFDVSLGKFEGNPMDAVGLAWDGTNYWTLHRDKRDTSLRARIYAYRINGTTGAGSYIGGDLPTGILWPSEMFGVTCIGSELFFLGRSRFEGMVWVTNLSGEYVRSFSYPHLGYTSSNPLTYRPGIGTDGTNIVIAQCDDAGPLNIRTYNKTTGAVIAQAKDSSDGTKSDVTGVYVGTADWGGTTKYAIIAKAKTQALPAFNATTGVYDSSKSFYVADGTNDTGVVWAGGKFHTLNAAGYINEYADSSTGDSTNNWWIAYRWETDADGDGTIDYYSKISPAARFTWPRRACLKAIGQPKPADVELMAGYMAKKTTAPARTDFKRNFTAYSSTRALSYWDWYQDTGSAPADANTFPTATPSLLASASGTFQAKGDGSGRWGPLTFDAAGRMKGAVCAGEVLVTPTGSSGTRTGNAYVTFPAGRFTTAPTVVVSANTTVPGTTVVGVGANGATTAGFTAYVARTNNTATGIAWIATEGH